MTETNREYHADTEWVSNTMLGVFRRESPEAYRQTFITKEMTRERTKQMLFGSVVDCLLLTPDAFQNEFGVVSASTRNTKKYQNAVEAEPDRDWILAEEYESAKACVNSVLNFPAARELLDRMTERQVIYRWVDDVTGMKLKAKLDLREPGQMTDACDLKTASEPEAPWWEINGARYYDYDMQSTMYEAGAKACCQPIKDFYFIVVQSAPPWLVRVCKVGPVWRQSGRAKFDGAVQGLHYSMQFDSWLAPWQQSVYELGGDA